MSTTTLESLPNELLTLLFEKYINGVDIIIAFASQQNQRIDDILAQCSRYSFDFLNCRKDHFHHCLARLPTYLAKIERLALSDYNTFGQVSAFLTTYPLLGDCQRLRKLYIHFDALATTWTSIQVVLFSMSTTPIHALTLKVINARQIDTMAMPMLDHPPGDDRRLLTLKRLACAGEVPTDYWEFLQPLAPNVEYLTHLNMHNSLGYPARFAKDYCRLKYLNIRFTPTSGFLSAFPSYHVVNSDASLPDLRTLILTFPADHLMTFEMFARWITEMPVLRHLDIKAHFPLVNAEKWETFLATSLLSLTYFRLKIPKRRIPLNQLEGLLDSFETPFWRDLPNFYFIIVDHQHSNSFLLSTSESGDDFSYPISRWWAVPFRGLRDPIPMSDATSFCVFEKVVALSSYYYFNNVQRLVVIELCDDRLLWLQEHINLSRIECLDLTHLQTKCAGIPLLLSLVPQITSLRVRGRQLSCQEKSFVGEMASVKSLAIVDAFADDDGIQTIARLFPNVEHLTFETTMICSVSLLQTHLPNLRSVTDQSTGSGVSQTDIFRLNTRIIGFRERILEQLERNDVRSMVLWIDPPVSNTSLEQSNNLQQPEADMDDSGINDMHSFSCLLLEAT